MSTSFSLSRFEFETCTLFIAVNSGISMSNGTRNPANDCESCLCGSGVCGWMMFEIRIHRRNWKVQMRNTIFAIYATGESILVSQQIPHALHMRQRDMKKTVSYRQPERPERPRGKSVSVLKQMSLESHRKYFYSPQFFMAGTAVTVSRSMRSPPSEENFFVLYCIIIRHMVSYDHKIVS